MEIHLFTAVFIYYYDIQLLQPVPKPVCKMDVCFMDPKLLIIIN